MNQDQEEKYLTLSDVSKLYASNHKPYTQIRIKVVIDGVVQNKAFIVGTDNRYHLQQPLNEKKYNAYKRTQYCFIDNNTEYVLFKNNNERIIKHFQFDDNGKLVISRNGKPYPIGWLKLPKEQINSFIVFLNNIKNE
jgi:hypothetical protein